MIINLCKIKWIELKIGKITKFVIWLKKKQFQENKYLKNVLSNLRLIIIIMCQDNFQIEILNGNVYNKVNKIKKNQKIINKKKRN